ncbi:MAG: DNA primase [Gammaproteobacteria bacterium]|nr:DNA primase [Gammaproteobacteria bacterium]
MAGKIPQHFIDELIDRADIVEVIDARVPLKKAGREYTACCPFHNEKSPSFTVSPTKQFYHCFGCGAHGTVISFLMEYEHMDFIEAIEELASRANMEIPREEGFSGKPAKSQRGLYDLLDKVALYYRQQLREHPQGEQAIAYLKDRGLSGDVAKTFSIGYAPPGWDNLSQALGADKDLQKQLLETGMLIEKENRSYDRFRERIMFPIRDTRGRVIAFGGRVMGDDTPKYLNSPETPIFHKGRELYGLYEARQALRQLPRLLVVEGYMDVVALAQFDIRYAVATLGTAVTADHLERLFRTTGEVVFCFDGDRAGRDAAWRGLENALPLMRDGRQLRFMFLPDGEDPDSMVRNIGKQAFEEQVEQAIPLSRFLFEQLRQKVDMGSLDGRAQLVELSRPLLSKLPSGVYHHMMVDQLAEIAHMERAPLVQLLDNGQAKTRATPHSSRGRTILKKQTPSPVRQAIQLLLHQPVLAQQVDNLQAFANLQLPGMGLLLEVLELLQQSPQLSSAALLERWRESDEGRHLSKLASQELLLSEDGTLEEEFRGILTLLKRQYKEQQKETLLAKSQQSIGSLSNEEKQQLRELLGSSSQK